MCIYILNIVAFNICYTIFLSIIASIYRKIIIILCDNVIPKKYAELKLRSLTILKFSFK